MMRRILAIFQVVTCIGACNLVNAQTLPVRPEPNYNVDHNAFISGKVTVDGSSQTPAGVVAVLSRVEGNALVPVSYALSDKDGNFTLTGLSGTTYRISYEYPTSGFSVKSGGPSANISAVAGNITVENLVLTRNENTITNCNASPLQATNWNDVIEVPKAEASTGATLNKVTVFSSAVVVNPKIEITASTEAIYTRLDFGADVSLLGPSFTPIHQLETAKQFAGSLVVNGVVDQRLILGQNQSLTYFDISSAKTTFTDLNSVPADYLGSGNVSFVANATAFTGTTYTGGNASFELTTDAMAGVCLTYTYTTNPLPVTLASFSAKAKTEGKYQSVDVNWSTTAELNSEKFEVEKSADAKKWQLIGTETASKNSKETINYTLTDIAPMAGKSYYRLKMVDLDGSFAYSRIVGMQLENDKIQVKVFPNPVAQELFVQEEGQQSVKEVTIFSNAGNVVSQTKEVSSEKGVNVKGLRTGTYVVRVKSNDGSHYTHRIVIAR
jgi:hypothetical protein